MPSPRVADSIMTGAQSRKWNVSFISSRSALSASPLTEIALVERDHQRAAGLLDHAGDARVLLGGPSSASITSTQTSARSIWPSAIETAIFSISTSIFALRRMPAVSTRT